MSGSKLDNDSRRSPLVATSILFLDFVKAAALLNPHSTKYVEGNAMKKVCTFVSIIYGVTDANEYVNREKKESKYIPSHVEVFEHISIKTGWIFGNGVRHTKNGEKPWKNQNEHVSIRAKMQCDMLDLGVKCICEIHSVVHMRKGNNDQKDTSGLDGEGSHGRDTSPGSDSVSVHPLTRSSADQTVTFVSATDDCGNPGSC
ncbi:hypothetical protein M514_10682 [Trichuris suis]|uniref:Uncharacterized protein n=1 Tax=Trichuris suis TaxID=68888 RepID=A0A085MY37_9BILA|nr:hypothetical protein M514_10682 [Trichuris suis]